MSARLLLNAVYSMLVEAHGVEETEAMFAPPEPHDRALSMLAMGGELA